MASTVLTQNVVYVQLENGTDDNGDMVLLDLPLGALSTPRFDATKALNIVMKLAPCMNKTINNVMLVQYSSIRP